MKTKATIVLAAMLWSGVVIAQSAEYRTVREKDSSFGNIRSRITLEIEAPSASTEREKLKAMMQAAVDRHRQDWPDAVSTRLWGSYENDSTIQNRIVYAPDGCGWSGGNCDGPIWTALFRGLIPEDLGSWGHPTKKASKDVACRNDLQCWGKKHALRAIFACQPLIESLAKYDYRWTDSWLESKLGRFRWNDRKEGSISYTGDKVQFQNPFGAWQKVTYWCHYSPESGHAEVNLTL